MEYIHRLQDGLYSWTYTGSDGNIRENLEDGIKGTEEQRKQRAQRAAARRLKRLVLANITPSSLFLTLTYSDEKCNEQEFYKAVVNYFKNYMKCGWIYVFERGKLNGRLHVHAFIFSPENYIVPRWKHGIYHIESIDDQIVRVANYIAKYPFKDNDYKLPEFVSRRFRSSTGLNRPVRIHDFEIDDCEILYSHDLVVDDVVYQRQTIYKTLT